jgi:hypothetical protein
MLGEFVALDTCGMVYPKGEGFSLLNVVSMSSVLDPFADKQHQQVMHRTKIRSQTPTPQRNCRVASVGWRSTIPRWGCQAIVNYSLIARGFRPIDSMPGLGAKKAFNVELPTQTKEDLKHRSICGLIPQRKGFKRQSWEGVHFVLFLLCGNHTCRSRLTGNA